MNQFTIKGVTIADFDAYLDSLLDNAQEPIGADEAKRVVPLLRRGQKKRAGAVSGVPYEILDGENDRSEEPRFAMLPGLVYKAEMALTAYGKAYIHKTRNRGGFVWPEWFAPRTVEPVADQAGRLAGFTRKVGTVEIPLKIEEMIALWQPDEDVELGPGQPPMQAALYAASTLHNTDVTVYSYFKRGAVRTTIFAVPQSTSDEEIKRLKVWWERIGTAVRNAFNTVFYRGGKLDPTIVGDPLTDIWNAELTKDKRQDIADALDIPVSMLLSNAANYATAESERAQWFQDFVFPRCQWYADEINRQWLSVEGLKMVYHPERTEIWQVMQLGQARGVSSVYQAGIIDRNEARELLGFAVVDSAEEEAPESEENAEETPDDEPQKALKADIEKWERYARKRYEEAHADRALLFESAAIPSSLQASIRGALQATKTADDVAAVFRSARQWAGYGFF